MQESTPEFGSAIEAGSVVFVDPKMRFGWIGQPADSADPNGVLSMVDAFEGRTVSNGWGTSSDGQYFWITNSPSVVNESVTGGSGRMAMVTRGQTDYAYIEDRPMVDSKVKLTGRMDTVVTAVAGETEQIYVALGATFRMDLTEPTGAYYLVEVANIGNNGYVYLRIFRKTVTGGYFLLKQQQIQEISHVATNVYVLEAECAGNILRGKVWIENTLEPQEPQIWFTTDATFEGDSGYTGVRSGMGKNTTMTLPYVAYFYNIEITDYRVLGEMSEYLGESFQVSHSLDDGMPDAVTSSAGSDPTGSFSADLVGTNEWDPRRTFSPFNTQSPFVDFPRDVAGIQLDHGVQTSIGAERIRLFTGQMSSLPLSGRDAAVEGISQTRTQLMRSIVLPVVNGDRMGSNATWIISYVLQACGLPLSPVPPRDGLVWWAPMHGTTRPFYPSTPNITTRHVYEEWTDGSAILTRPQFRRSSYALGIQAYLNNFDSGLIFSYNPMSIPLGNQTWSKANTQGRIEFLIKAPTHKKTGGSWVDFSLRMDYGPEPGVRLRTEDTGELVGVVEDGTGASTASARTFSSGLVIPDDGQWHSVGFYWNGAGNELRFRLDGVEKAIIPSPALSIVNLTPTDNFKEGFPYLRVAAPFGEFRWWNGQYSDPTKYGWNDYIDTTPGTTVSTEDWEDTTYAITWSGTWARSNTRAFAGSWSIKSAAIGHNSTSDLVITVPPGSSQMSFWYWVSSEESWDWFQVIINGVVVYEDSGESTEWTQLQYEVNGISSVTLRYIKDDAVVRYDDAVYVDQVVFTGTATNPVSTWVDKAVVYPVDLELVAVTQWTPEEAWAILSRVAQATLSMMRTDEYDRLNFLPPSYFAEDAQMAVTGTISTELNAEDPEVTQDPSKIRNSVQVNYLDTRVDEANSFVLVLKTALSLKPGKVNITFPLDVPVVWVDTSFSVYTANTSNIESLFSVNTNVDGTGPYFGAGAVTARVVAWEASWIRIEFTNHTASVLYLTNNFGSDMPFLGISGRAVRESPASITIADVKGMRGERSLTVDAPTLQSRSQAILLATSILGRTIQPLGEVTVTVFGDPRRQPGDVVALEDPQGTQIMGSWRILSVDHDRSGANYTQTLKLVSVVDMALWDTDGLGWDQGAWSN